MRTSQARHLASFSAKAPVLAPRTGAASHRLHISHLPIRIARVDIPATACGHLVDSIIDFDLEPGIVNFSVRPDVSAASAMPNSALKWPSTIVANPSVGGRSARIVFFGSGSSIERTDFFTVVPLRSSRLMNFKSGMNPSTWSVLTRLISCSG
jgi:hypothetical protein